MKKILLIIPFIFMASTAIGQQRTVSYVVPSNVHKLKITIQKPGRDKTYLTLKVKPGTTFIIEPK